MKYLYYFIPPTNPSGYTQQGGPASAAIAGQMGKMLQMQLLETNNNINAIKEGAEQPFFLANGILYIPTTGGATFTYGNRAPSYDGYLREVVVSGSRSGSNSNRFQFKSVSNANYQLDFGPAGGGGNGFGIANDIIGGADVVNGLVGFNAAINSKHAYRYAQRINGSVVSAAELTATNQAKALKVLNVSKSIGNKLGVAGGLVIAGDVLYNSEVKASHGINAVITGIAFTGWGAPVAGIWFVADFGTGLITGKSISDRIDSGVGAPLVDWDW